MEASEQSRLEELYREALERNDDATRRLSTLLGQENERPRGTRLRTAVSRQQRLASHLEIVRSSNYNDNIQILAKYSEQVGAVPDLTNFHDDYEAAASHAGQHGVDADSRAFENAAINAEIDGLLHTTKTLTSDLELALIKARQRLKHERALLDNIRGQYQLQQRDSSPSGTGAISKLQALEVTRSELQAWIADSLAKCEQTPDMPPDVDVSALSGMSPARELLQQDLEDKYESYVTSRARLLGVVRALKMPLEPLTSGEAQAHQRESMKHDRPGPGHRTASSVSGHGFIPRPSLSGLQYEDLQNYSLEKLLNMHSMHFQECTQNHDFRLSQLLGLLNHESHLLPAHTAHDLEGSVNTTTYNHKQRQVDQLLRAWASSSHTASRVLNQGLERHVEAAKVALTGADDVVEELGIMHEMKREVLG
ncbi:hypothetical protein LTR64_000293 [Lithohypha guttulata]|uniref:uncharacterized protein n=1 Tax=Lithohypha guttulata TaxID=1690604 RepID=UPI002DDF0170|nr:hypothetical protein LTR51_007654 [Lithohypha guttulata]